MSKRHPNECPICEKIPCRCPGGCAPDDEKSMKNNAISVEKRKVSFINNTVAAPVFKSQQLISGQENTHSTLLNKKNELLYCTFFASTENQFLTTPFNNLQDDNAPNATSSSSTIVKMGGMGE